MHDSVPYIERLWSSFQPWITILRFLDYRNESNLKLTSKSFRNLLYHFRQCSYSGRAYFNIAKCDLYQLIYTNARTIAMPSFRHQALANLCVETIEPTLLPIKCHLQHFHDKSNGYGLGVVSDQVIPRGSRLFVYAGEMISTREAKRREKQRQLKKDKNYLLVIKEHVRNYDDEDIHDRSSTSKPYNPSVTLRTNIDASYIGNISRFINHSCDPSLEVIMVRCHHLHHHRSTLIPHALVEEQSLFAVPVLTTRRIIAPNEQLTFHYGGGNGSDNVSDNLDDNMASDDCGDNTSEGYRVERVKCYCMSNLCSGYMPYDTS